MYTEYHTGDGEAALCVAGWFRGNSDSQTQAVGGKQPNRFGLYDMHGNVGEWCVGGWDERAYSHRAGYTLDPIRDDIASFGRGTRGGSYIEVAPGCRAACRYRYRPASCGNDQGFRVGLFPFHLCQSAQPAK